ncbi:hypothetical protein LTR74_018718, partial [Friedmanniomyces endolithicus]
MPYALEDARQSEALQWTDGLRCMLFQAQGQERRSILEREALNLLREVHFAALRAEVLWLEGADVCERSSLWAQIQGLAAQAERVRRTDQLRDPKHFRALLFVTKTWGLDKVDRYQWRW